VTRDRVIATLKGTRRNCGPPAPFDYHSSAPPRAATVIRDSDVDSLAAFDEARKISLLDVAGFELQLSELLGQAVELVEEGMLKPRVQKSIEAEACVPSKLAGCGEVSAGPGRSRFRKAL